MEQISIVYGNIIGVPNNHALQKADKSIIETLAADDPRWPWIGRDTFLVPDADNSKIYRSQVIVFGASYKQVEEDWEAWLGKFDSLLAGLSWVSATVHLDAELLPQPYTYDSTCDIKQRDGWAAGAPAPKPSQIGHFSGGPRAFYTNGLRIDPAKKD